MLVLFLCAHLVGVVLSQQKFVTCGSSFKLLNTDYDARLHSHEVEYGSGSGQQSVTGMDSAVEFNSYWQIVERNGAPPCERGRAIKCGQRIRLLHLATRKNLHSHHFQSPLSRNYEVSAFGVDGVGDEGDDWTVMCSGKHWEITSKIRFKHVSTSGFLHLSGKRYSRPIAGQYEVAAVQHAVSGIHWKATEGMYVRPMEANAWSAGSSTESEHDEL